jgi:hypothetical protein
MSGQIAQRNKPAFLRGQNQVDVKIEKVGIRKYRVDRVHVANGTTVTWIADGFEPTEIVVFFPDNQFHEVGNPLSVQVNGLPGIYHYGLFVCVDNAYYGVEGNSPPEMIIE